MPFHTTPERSIFKVSASAVYGDKRACNNQTGPGCDSRRLHQSSSAALGGEHGADQDRRMGKDVAFARMGSVISPLLKLPTTTLLKKCVSLRKQRDHFAS
jgi:hypothetical protein